MSPSLEQLKDAAAVLPVPQRAELAHFLLQSLNGEDEDAAEAWQAELARRVSEIKSGQVVGVPAEDVLARLREHYP